MFKQVKSALIWFYLYKFRRSVITIAVLLLLVFFANSIYTDVVEYLQLTQQLYLLKYALFLKWGIMLGGLGWILFILLNLFKKVRKNKTDPRQKHQQTSPLSEQEQRLMTKGKLTSRADQIIERKKGKKQENNIRKLFRKNF